MYGVSPFILNLVKIKQKQKERALIKLWVEKTRLKIKYNTLKKIE